MQLTFKAKVYQGQILPSLAMREVVQAPKDWKRSHVSDAGKASPYLNSNMLGAVIQRELKRAGFGRLIDVSEPPDGVEVERRGPLAFVTVNV
jgi:hypothetical protein